MQDAKERLGYDELTATVRHYRSIALLDQTIFAVRRQKSALAKDYQALANRIAEANPEDALAALRFLKEVVRDYSAGRPPPYTPSAVSERVNEITARHEDGEILYWAARVRETAGDWKAALDALDRAIEVGFDNSEAHLQRGLLRMTLNDDALAATDALWVLRQSRNVQVEHVVGAVQILLKADPNQPISMAPAIVALSADDKLFLCKALQGFAGAHDLMVSILSNVAADPMANERRRRAQSLLDSLQDDHVRA
jgi:tetratricopeptide (TPR) repeat protein